MMNRTDATRQTTRCAHRTWCDGAADHLDPHSAEADLPKITATGCREHFGHHDDGVAVPEVWARLVEHEESNTFEMFTAELGVARPDGRNAVCYLTMREAELLEKALRQVRGVPSLDRAAGVR